MLATASVRTHYLGVEGLFGATDQVKLSSAEKIQVANLIKNMIYGESGKSKTVVQGWANQVPCRRLLSSSSRRKARGPETVIPRVFIRWL